MRLEDFDHGDRFKAEVLSNDRITSLESSDEIREISLQVSELSFDYEVGQSVGVIVPGSSEIGHEHHFRLYTLADTAKRGDKGLTQIKLCVKRCSYIDEYSGEEYQGIASNYLCDLLIGDQVELNGPFGQAFPLPEDKASDLLLIGMGTGIAPFRAFLKHLYQNVGDWSGKVRLFYGAKTGLELLYMNEHKDDVAQYYDEETFEAIHALSPRAHWSNKIDFQNVIEQRGEEILDVLNSEKGCVYIAGRLEIEQTLDEIFAKILGSDEKWKTLKAKLVEQSRWVELIY